MRTLRTETEIEPMPIAANLEQVKNPCRTMAPQYHPIWGHSCQAIQSINTEYRYGVASSITFYAGAAFAAMALILLLNFFHSRHWT
jgi:hypothetical protein